MNILVIAPHPDDESIGCGGAICRHVEAGERVVTVFLTSGELGLKHLPREAAWRVREAEASAAAKVLGFGEMHFLRQPDWTLHEALQPAATALAAILARETPQLVYVPHPREWHPDHQAAVAILQHSLALSRVARPEIRAYEVWTPLAQYDVVIDITTVMPRKLEAIRSHPSQLKEIDYAHAAQGLNAYRGAVAGRVRFAEVFQKLEADLAVQT